MSTVGIVAPDQGIDRLQRFYAFECSEQFHLAELSPVCALIYGLAYRLTKGGELPFFPSAFNIGQYINRSPHQVRRGLKKLEEYGFLVLEDARKFRPNQYRVITHNVWAKLHPGRCCTKMEYSYTEDGDPLGQKLWALSGGRISFQSFQIRNLRALEATDEEIAQEFEKFWNERGNTLKPSDVSPYFYTITKTKYGLRSIPAEGEQQ